jgi:hypothetical protein
MNRAHERWVTAAAQTLQLAAFPQQNHLIYAVFRVKKAAATGGSSNRQQQQQQQPAAASRAAAAPATTSTLEKARGQLSVVLL